MNTGWDAEAAMDSAWGPLRSPEREAREKARADGEYDAWRGWRADPTLLNDDYADEYMEGYRSMKP